jgi:hypothetical protein
VELNDLENQPVSGVPSTLTCRPLSVITVAMRSAFSVLITVPMKAYGETIASVAHEAYAADELTMAIRVMHPVATARPNLTDQRLSHVSRGCHVAFIGEPGSGAAALAVLGEGVPALH